MQKKKTLILALLPLLLVGGVFAASPLISTLWTSGTVSFIDAPEVPVPLAVVVSQYLTPTYVGDPCGFTVKMTNDNLKTSLTNITVEISIYGTDNASYVSLVQRVPVHLGGFTHVPITLSSVGGHLVGTVTLSDTLAPSSYEYADFQFTASTPLTLSYTVQVTSYPAP